MKVRGSYEVIVETKSVEKKHTTRSNSSNQNFLLCFAILGFIAMWCGITIFANIQTREETESNSIVSISNTEEVTLDDLTEVFAEPVTIQETFSEPNSGTPVMVNVTQTTDPVLDEEPVVEEEPEVVSENTLEEQQPIHTKMTDDELVVDEGPPDPEYKYVLSDEEREILERVVEAEVRTQYRFKGHDITEEQLLQAKMRVAQVFYNRVADTNKFADTRTMKKALLTPGATSTISNGSYYRVKVTDVTKEAVELALRTDTYDYSEGGLFFHSGKTETSPYGDFLFTDDVGHHFFK